jgi:hypothetical protein
LTSAVAIVPVIVALVQVAKMVGLPSKFSPLVSLGAGILISFLFGNETGNISQSILSGVVYGLSASGLYSGIKTTAHATNNETTVNGSNLLNSERQEDGTKVMFVETNKEDNH